ncbi:Lipopolysaccharide export system protein LptA [bacterium HR30]|nr:Lipopolysaccharide export system protein LptA [bacterium HR30]
MKWKRSCPKRLHRVAGYLAVGILCLVPVSPALAQSDNPTGAKQPLVGQSDWLGALSFSNTKEPVFLKADKLEFRYETRVLIYQGSVEVNQGDITLAADEVRVFLSPADRMEIQEVRANGNVRLTQGARWATAKEATFDHAKRVAILRGAAVLHDGLNEVRGETVTVYLDERRSVVDGGEGRVQAVFYPGTGEHRRSREQDSPE